MIKKNGVSSGSKIIDFRMKIKKDFLDFMRLEVSGSLVLLTMTIIALIAANSVLGESFEEFWHLEFAFQVGTFEFGQSLLHWIDDGLMAVFFFVVGLEIKREVLVGERSSIRKASLPILAAVGGMVIPAGFYLLFNWGGEGASGWGVPMATDIAFALGVITLLGKRVPTSLKVFLTALAIADDIGAVLVIALFYTSQILWGWLGIGFLLLGLLVIFNLLRIDNPIPYVVVASVIWFAFLNSGVHATIAGVLVAFTIPATARTEPTKFVGWARGKLDEIEGVHVAGAHVLEDPKQQHCAMEIQEAARHISAPLQRLEHGLHPITTFLILPLFALANAGVVLEGDVIELLAQPVTIGVVVGLLLGKPIGITLLSWLAVKLGIADLPQGVRWSHVVGAGMLGGIGFTMSIFVSNLAFTDHLLQSEAKLAILITSLLAGVMGYVFLRYVTRADVLTSEGT